MGLVEVEFHVQLDAHDLGWLFGNRSRLRHWLWSCCYNRCRLAATTEVHANADAWSPLGVALIDIVLSFNASTSIEVLGDEVLGTAANVGKGGAVTAAATGLTDALIRETGRDVRTQRVTGIVEVIQRIEGGVRALDVATVFATSVVYFVIGQTQFNVVGQVVTDAAAEQITVVLEVTSAVEDFLLGKALDLNRALALSQSTKRSRRQHRTNDNAQSVFNFHP
ncbi:hypothetical protein D3C85_1220160 [compost metagenome]